MGQPGSVRQPLNTAKASLVSCPKYSFFLHNIYSLFMSTLNTDVLHSLIDQAVHPNGPLGKTTAPGLSALLHRMTTDLAAAISSNTSIAVEQDLASQSTTSVPSVAAVRQALADHDAQEVLNDPEFTRPLHDANADAGTFSPTPYWRYLRGWEQRDGAVVATSANYLFQDFPAVIGTRYTLVIRVSAVTAGTLYLSNRGGYPNASFQATISEPGTYTYGFAATDTTERLHLFGNDSFSGVVESASLSVRASVQIEQDLSSNSATAVPSVAAVKAAVANAGGAAGDTSACVHLSGDETIHGTKNFADKVGIGTSAPAQKLVVSSESTEVRLGSGCQELTPAVSVINTAGGKAAAILAGIESSGLYFDRTGAFSITATDHSAFTDNNLSCQDGLDALVVTGTGNIGVNTSQPGQKLEVAGNVKAQQFMGDGSQVTGVVHQAGEEVIAGGKTFTQPQHFADLDAETGAVVGQVDVSGHGVVFGPDNPRATWRIAATGDDNLEILYNAYVTGLVPSFKICPTNLGDDSSAVEMRTLKSYVAANTSQVTIVQDLKSDSTTSVPSVHAVNTAPLSNYAIGSASRAIVATDTAKSAIGVLEYKLNATSSNLNKLLGNSNFGLCLGGEYSSVNGSYSAVLGGHDNTISGSTSVVGASNQVTLNANFTAAFGFSSSMTVPAWVTNGVVAPTFWLQAGANGSNSATYFYKLSASSYGGLLFNGAPAALRFRGDWTTQAFYAKHDVVIYNGVTYFALNDQTDAQNSSFNTSNWKPWATGTAPVSSELKSTVATGTFGSGELQGTQPSGSLPGMRFVDATYRYEYQLGMNDTNGTSYVWVRTAKA